LFLEVILVLVQRSMKKGHCERIGGTSCPAGRPCFARKGWDLN